MHRLCFHAADGHLHLDESVHRRHPLHRPHSACDTDYLAHLLIRCVVDTFHLAVDVEKMDARQNLAARNLVEDQTSADEVHQFLWLVHQFGEQVVHLCLKKDYCPDAPLADAVKVALVDEEFQMDYSRVAVREVAE
jgi:hypothetical protein